MRFKFLIIVSLHIARLETSSLKGIPVPKADVLDELLTKFFSKKDYTGSIFNYLRGNESAGMNNYDNLDISILDVDNVRKLIDRAKNQYSGNFRRKSEGYKIGKAEFEHTKTTALNMMKQSVYATRFRLEETKRFRKAFTNNLDFNMAIFYGALMQVIIKIETLYSNMRRFKFRTHFLWYLVIYEKILAANVDAHNIVERIFYLHDLFVQNKLHGKEIVIAPAIWTTASRTRRRRRTATRRLTRSTKKRGTLPDGYTGYVGEETQASRAPEDNAYDEIDQWKNSSGHGPNMSSPAKSNEETHTPTNLETKAETKYETIISEATVVDETVTDTATEATVKESALYR